MTREEIPALFIVLAGYFGATAPDVDDPVAVAGYLDLLADHDFDSVRDAARRLAVDVDARFCPNPGQLAAACQPRVVPPYHAPYVPELTEGTEGEVDVVTLLTEARRRLRGETG